MAISKIQKISKKELTRIEKVIGESFVTIGARLKNAEVLFLRI